jgi:osmotically-inducible protein OsmY
MRGNTTGTFLLLSAVVILNGCAAAAVTGIATTAAVATDRRTTGTIVEDRSISLKVRRAILREKELNRQSHINITTYNLNVLLTGETPTEEFRNRLGELARNVEKVKQVFNEVTIAAPSSMITRSSDSVITSKVKTKLVTDANIDGLNIKVVTENGVVFLMGLLTREEAERATEAVRTTGGVQRVVRLFEYVD